MRRAINPCLGGLESTGGEIRSGEVLQMEGGDGEMGREAEESGPGTCRRSWRLSGRRERKAGCQHWRHTALKGAAGFG